MTRSGRRQNGSYLIELLVALAISGLLAVALGASVCQTKGISNRSENNLMASLITQQVFERLRSTPFDSLPALGIAHNVRVNLGDTTDSTVYESNSPILNRALLIDGTNLQWLGYSSSQPIPQYKFRGDVVLQLRDGPVPSVTKTATVTVSWSDSSASAPHSLQVSRVLSRYGVQRNAQN